MRPIMFAEMGRDFTIAKDLDRDFVSVSRKYFGEHNLPFREAG
jgi:hypothetical protein